MKSDCGSERAFRIGRVAGLALRDPVALSWGIDHCFCGRLIEQQETEESVPGCWGECFRMKVVRLYRASRIVLDEASRKTWQVGVEQRSGVQQLMMSDLGAARNGYDVKLAPTRREGNATDIRRRERVARHLSAR
jgi:hypothetical protein